MKANAIASPRDLTAENLCAHARERTGLNDFGPPHFMAPLEVLLKAMREEAKLHDAGLAQQSERVVNALANRLRKHDFLACHPDIADEEVQVAAIIAGLPRTGSTMLHRLLGAADQLTAPYWWESMYPLPFEGEQLAQSHERRAAAEALAAAIIAASKDLEAIHPLDAKAHDEELVLIEQSFMSTLPESMMYLPSYGAWMETADQSAAYDELIDYLKILQWQTPARRGKKWVLKAPHHLTAAQTVLDKFPGAVFVMTHRPIVTLMPSWYSFVASTTQTSDTDHARAQAEHWTQRWRNALMGAMAARRNAPERFVDIGYRDLVERPLDAAAQVFQRARLRMSDKDAAAMGAWLDANQRDARPSHKYALDQFGVTEERLRRDFAFYIEAIPQ